MGSIQAVKILNGTESYSAVVGKVYDCPDCVRRIVTSIHLDVRSELVGIQCEGGIEVSVSMDRCLLQWYSGV